MWRYFTAITLHLRKNTHALICSLIQAMCMQGYFVHAALFAASFMCGLIVRVIFRSGKLVILSKFN